jgi:hypothetical protein
MNGLEEWVSMKEEGRRVHHDKHFLREVNGIGRARLCGVDRDRERVGARLRRYSSEHRCTDRPTARFERRIHLAEPSICIGSKEGHPHEAEITRRLCRRMDKQADSGKRRGLLGTG